MPTVYCRNCGNAIDESASFCPTCGTPQTSEPQNGIPAPKENKHYATYSEVPWYRKNWFAILCFLIFWPGLLIVLLSGNIYYERKGVLRAYGLGTKIFLIVYCLVILAWFLTQSGSPLSQSGTLDHTALFNSCVNQNMGSGKHLSAEAGENIGDCLSENSQFDLQKVDYTRLDSEQAKYLYNQTIYALNLALQMQSAVDEGLKLQNQAMEQNRATLEKQTGSQTAISRLNSLAEDEEKEIFLDGSEFSEIVSGTSIKVVFDFVGSDHNCHQAFAKGQSEFDKWRKRKMPEYNMNIFNPETIRQMDREGNSEVICVIQVKAANSFDPFYIEYAGVNASTNR
jgi:hypothetical protein